MTETATFVCSICNEPSSVICVYCTKDACRNHRCHRCKRCSDCCECEVPLTAPEFVNAESEQPPPSAPVVEVLESDPVELPAVPEASEEPDMNTPPASVIERFPLPQNTAMTDDNMREDKLHNPGDWNPRE